LLRPYRNLPRSEQIPNLVNDREHALDRETENLIHDKVDKELQQKSHARHLKQKSGWRLWLPTTYAKPPETC